MPEQIAPYLRPYKATRAKVIIEYYINLTPRNGRYTEEIRAERNRFLTLALGITAQNSTVVNFRARTPRAASKNSRMPKGGHLAGWSNPNCWLEGCNCSSGLCGKLGIGVRRKADRDGLSRQPASV